MITRIPEGQICQSFDPKMHLSNEILERQGVTQNASVSCVAPAYVYIEGIHGKKFLCDYHYHYERYMTQNGYSKPNISWKNIQEFVIDERERVKETFAKDVTTTETSGHKCSLINSYDKRFGCTADALVKVIPTGLVPNKINFTAIKDKNNISESIFYCNFHFRREYHRYCSNGVIYENFHKIIDERYRMTFTLANEALNLTYV
jgi:hypothetical protein